MRPRVDTASSQLIRNGVTRKSGTCQARTARVRLASLGRVLVAAIALLCCAPLLAAPVFDAAALSTLATRSVETGSDSVVVYLHGVKIFDYHSPKPAQPLYIMSCTKSIVALAIGAAIAEGKIKSMDQPIHDFFPEWNQGRKKRVTIRHVLSMTSGIQNEEDIYSFPDSVKVALAADVAREPGDAFSYSNVAVNLLAGVIHVATGEWLDAYVDEHFFTPMGIDFWKWARDDAGNAFAFADLELLPDDFAKFGTLVLQHGVWDGKQLVPRSWIDGLGAQSQPHEPLYGVLWWRLPTGATGTVTSRRLDALARLGADVKLIKQLRPLVGKTVHGTYEWHRLLAAAVPDWEARMYTAGLIDAYGNEIPTWHYDGFDGLAALGYLGQHLVVFPDLDLVAVRQIAPFEGYDYLRNRFEDFPDLVRKLAVPRPDTLP
jgi:CubicO group peptidase (beta-lactamase class C family)